MREVYRSQVGGEYSGAGENHIDCRDAKTRLVIARIEKCRFTICWQLTSLAKTPNAKRGPVESDRCRNPTEQRYIGETLADGYANSEGALINLSCIGGRRSVAKGVSPNRARYSTEKRPNSQKP